MSARVINLVRFKERRERARRRAAIPRAEGRTLVVDGLKLRLAPSAASALAEQIDEVLLRGEQVRRGGIVICPVQGRRGNHRFSLDLRCFDMPLTEVSRAQLAAIAHQMLTAEGVAR